MNTGTRDSKTGVVRVMERVCMWLLGITLACALSTAKAADTTQSEELMSKPEFVDPKVERNDIHDAAIDNENFELGLFLGLFSTEDFGTNPVYGIRFAYHVNEDVFFELATGFTKTQKTSAEKVLDVEFLAEDERELTYYNFSVGWNFLPGETFFGSSWAFHSSIYLIGGAGFTEFAGDSFFTLNAGIGYRILITDWMAAHVDFRDHAFKIDIFGEEKMTHNIEMHGGITFFF